jgi:hypothetical protein
VTSLRSGCLNDTSCNSTATLTSAKHSEMLVHYHVKIVSDIYIYIYIYIYKLTSVYFLNWMVYLKDMENDTLLYSGRNSVT